MQLEGCFKLLTAANSVQSSVCGLHVTKCDTVVLHFKPSHNLPICIFGYNVFRATGQGRVGDHREVEGGRLMITSFSLHIVIFKLIPYS